MKKKLTAIYKKVLHIYRIAPHLALDCTGQMASNAIRERLQNNDPCMIGRFGENELRTLVTYLNEQQGVKPNIRGWLRQESFSLETGRVKDWMRDIAGFFPSNRQNLSRFADLLMADMQQVDILGCWLPKECRIRDLLPNTMTAIRLRDLRPWQHGNPWTSALKAKRVLVIHPFVESIQKQYAKSEKMFVNPEILPEFDLLTYQSVQSVAGTDPGFASWFEAFNHMCGEIDNLEFDIAIIGAGAYGFPLAAHIKRTGRKAIHLGGVTQLLFGIKGRRWDGTAFSKQYYNAHWVRPSRDETPAGKNKVEGGSYW